jgi:3-oxoacyl-[acyl-carrier protein] reductase
MSGDMTGKRVLLTGGSRGIGRATVLELARRGADVAFTYTRSAESAEAVRAEAEGFGHKALAVQSDVTSFEAAKALVDEVKSAFGGVDVLVNNAGIVRDKLILQMSEDDWDAVMDTNLKGVFNVTKHVAALMVRQRKGRVVNIGSISGLAGFPGQSNYAASKAALGGFTKSLANELGRRNVSCVTLALGIVETEMTAGLAEEYVAKLVERVALRRAAKAEEIARIVATFCGDEMEYVNGQVIVVDGGGGI